MEDESNSTVANHEVKVEIERKSDSRPRNIVDSSCGRNRTSSVEDDRKTARINHERGASDEGLAISLDVLEDTIWIPFAQSPRDDWSDSTDKEEENKGADHT